MSMPAISPDWFWANADEKQSSREIRKAARM
jgi:hypothetical protein